jgi:hypothetical protein
MFGRGMIKKVLMYLILGPLGLLMGGSFNIMDLLMIPMIAGVFGPILGNITGGAGLGNLFGGGAAATAGATT